MKSELAAITVLVLLTLSVLFWDARRLGPTARPISDEIATTTIERLKDWSTWQTGIATATIAAMGFFVQRPNQKFRRGQRRWAVSALLFLGLSILLSVWLVSLLPGFLLQLSDGMATGNDLYRHKFTSVTNVQLPALLVLQHVYFVIGLISFAVMIYLMFPDEQPNKVA